MANDVIIDIQHLTKSFDGVTVLHLSLIHI